MKGEVREVAIGDREYPRELEEIADPPKRLWIRGLRLDELTPRVAVVGSRTPTPYGEQTAEDLAADLALRGVCVVSGLARGCDGAAHRGALRAPRGRTIAVLGTGIDVCHPKPHRALAERIAQNGALVTEFPPGVPGWPSNFRARNRIISGLSVGVVIVQAAPPSGALITASHAKAQNRHVFAVPGNVDVAQSEGPHGLIREGAVLVKGASDVLADIEAQTSGLPDETPSVSAVEGLPPVERALLEALGSASSLDSAAIRAGIRGSEAAAALVRLELAGLVVRTPRGLWRRAR